MPTEELTGAVREARMYSVQPAVEEASRSFEIVGTAANDGSMKPGMFATVTFSSPEPRNTVWLPAAAVATSDLPQVLMVEDGAIAFRKVQLGRRSNGSLEIVDGLAADEQVVADVSGLSRGIPVTVIEAGPCVVVQRKTKQHDGYEAIQVGFGQKRENLFSKPEKGHFAKANLKPMRFLRDRRLDHARAEILRRPGARVTDIAVECGFSHLGRFAQQYGARFGEAPSRTRR